MIERIASLKNLFLAYRRAATGKRRRPDVAAFEYRLEEHIVSLAEELRTRTWRPGPYHCFFIHDPKRRLIAAAPFRDRVVHHALCYQTEDRFERAFISDTFANRVGLGTHRAIDRAQQFARRFRYVLQIDVRQFFPCIDHRVLRAKLGQIIDDEVALWIVDEILRSGLTIPMEGLPMVSMPGDSLLDLMQPRGLPIGNLTSQLWGNVYLSGLDHFIKRTLRCKGYVRYVDDLLLFGDSKETLWDWKRAVEERLLALRLRIHPGAHPRPVSEGFPFLGFVLFPDRRRLKGRKVRQFRRKLEGLRDDMADGGSWQDFSCRVAAWVNHARHGDTEELRRAMLAGISLDHRLMPKKHVGCR